MKTMSASLYIDIEFGFLFMYLFDFFSLVSPFPVKASSGLMLNESFQIKKGPVSMFTVSMLVGIIVYRPNKVALTFTTRLFYQSFLMPFYDMHCQVVFWLYCFYYIET